MNWLERRDLQPVTGVVPRVGLLPLLMLNTVNGVATVTVNTGFAYQQAVGE